MATLAPFATHSLLAQIWRGRSHFSQKLPLANVAGLASITNVKYFGECEFDEYLIKAWRVFQV
jgi:hypothetical protein